MLYRALSAVLAGVFIAGTTASAATVTLTAAEDTFISENFPGPNGAMVDMVIGVQGAMVGFDRNRALLRFDLSAIPAGAVVTSATLRVSVNRNPTAAPNIEFHSHRMLRPWNESESTWTVRVGPTEAWGTPGGEPGTDFATAVSGMVTISAVGSYEIPSSAGIVADVTAWLANPATNYGWLVKQGDESATTAARRVGSSEAPAGQPQLTVNYTVSEPLRISSARIQAGEFCLQFATHAGKSYRVERKQSLAAGDWIPVTTLPPAGQDSTANVCDPPGAPTGFYRVVEL